MLCKERHVFLCGLIQQQVNVLVCAKSGNIAAADAALQLQLKFL